MATGFQTSVNLQQASAVEGDFASSNPRSSVVSHEGTLVSGATGTTVGRFAWAVSGVTSNAGSGKPTGFVHRLQGEALITTFLAETSMLIPQGYPVTLMATGDYYATITVAPATIGNKAFASLTTGQIQPGAAGATISGYIETDFFITGFPVGGTGAVGELAVISRVQ